MAGCLTAPSHYLNQFWLIINRVCGICLTTILQEVLKLSILKISLKIKLTKLKLHLWRDNDIKGKIYWCWRWNIFMMMSSNGNILCIASPLWGESTSHWWIPLTKASAVEIWYFLWSVPEQTVAQTQDSSDLGCHHAHYDVTVMLWEICVSWLLFPGSLLCPVISNHDIDCAMWMVPCLPWGKISTTCSISVLRNDREFQHIFVFPSTKNHPPKGQHSKGLQRSSHKHTHQYWKLVLLFCWDWIKHYTEWLIRRATEQSGLVESWPREVTR